MRKSEKWKVFNQVMAGKTDDMDFINTYPIGVFYGITFDYTWISAFRVFRCVSVALLGAIHNGLTIILHHAEHDVLSLMELFHYVCLFYSLLSICVVTLYQSKNTKSFCEMLDKEFNNPNIVLSPKQLKIKQDTNKFIAFMGKVVAVSFFCGCAGSSLRRPLLEPADPVLYRIPYIGWVPFRVDNMIKCIAVWIFQAAISLNVVYGHFSFFISFAIHSSTLYSQCEMLTIYIKETFLYENIKCTKREENIVLRLKEIVKTHQLLIRCYSRLKNVYNFSLLAMGLASGLMFCTTIYMVTDPASTVYMKVSVFSFMLPEFALIGLFCWFGQRIIDKWEMIKETIYNLDWHNESRNTKKTLLLIMTMCTRDQVMKGGGLQEFSMKGYSELLQAGFSSFNMLKALR